jgi:hypothetical protein
VVAAAEVVRVFNTGFYQHICMLLQAVRAAPHMGCALPRHLVHTEDYLSPAGPGLSQAASCIESTPQYPHVHFSRHVIGLVYTQPKRHKKSIDTAHTGLHMDPIGAACLLLADGPVRSRTALFLQSAFSDFSASICLNWRVSGPASKDSLVPSLCFLCRRLLADVFVICITASIAHWSTPEHCEQGSTVVQHLSHHIPVRKHAWQ